MFGKKKYRSRELEEKKRRRLERLGVISAFVLLVLFILSVSVPRLRAFSIKHIGVTGNSIESTDTLTSYIEEGLSGSYFFLYPKKSWLFYPKRTLEAALLNDFKRFEDVELSYEGSNSLLLQVKERKPDWMWCEEKKCYFMDEERFIFASAPNFSGPVFFKVSGPLLNEGEPVGNYFAPPWQFSEMKEFLKKIEQVGYEPISLSVDSEGDTYITLKNQTVLKTSISKSFSETLLDLEDATLSEMVSPENKYEYIDLRFKDKVYYK